MESGLFENLLLLFAFVEKMFRNILGHKNLSLFFLQKYESLDLYLRVAEGYLFSYEQNHYLSICAVSFVLTVTYFWWKNFGHSMIF